MATLTPDEIKSIAEAFETMGVKPKADTKEDFTAWLADYTKTGPPVTNPNHVHLINFSGDKKSDSTYDLWRYQVGCLKKTYKLEQVMHAVRRSLRGEAARVLMRLGPDVTLDEMIEKMDSVYGVLEGDEAVLAEFYAARQQPAENVSMWGCRLEDLLSRVSKKVITDPVQYDQRLKEMYWKGMRAELRDISGHLFDGCKTFDDLRVAMRRVENDLEERNKRPKPAHAITKDATSGSANDKELKAMAAKLSTEVSNLKSGMTVERDQRYESGRDGFSGNRRRGYRRGRGYGYGQGRGRGTGYGTEGCWSCGQYGHFSRECTSSGNYQRSNRGGGSWTRRNAQSN